MNDPAQAAGAPVTVRALFVQANFRRVWAVGAYSGVVRWLELLAVGIYVFEITRSPTMVVLFSLLRLLPMGLFGAFMGALTDRVGKRRTLVLGLAATTSAALVLAVSAWNGHLTLWQLAASAVLGGFFWTTDLPARRNLLGTLAGPGGVPAAMAFDAATSNVSRALGPALGGLLLAVIGIEGAFALSTVLYALALLAILRVPKAAAGETLPRPGRHGKLFLEVLEGLRFARSDRAIVGALAVTVVFNVFGWPYTSLIPVVGGDILKLEPFAVGMLMSTEGVGALLGAIAAGWAVRRWSYRRIYFYGALSTQIAIVALAQAGSVHSAGVAVVLAGFGAGAFSAMQSTVIYLLSPPEMRARMLGVLSVCIGSALIGYVHIGLMVDWWGTMPAIAISGIEGLVALALVWLLWPEIR